MSNDNSSSPTLTDVTFSDNWAGFGGGMSNYRHSSPMLINVTFSGNSAVQWGGGMENNDSSPTLTNVTFSANRSFEGGGGMYNLGGSPTLTDVTFSDNSATYYGGGMSNRDSSPVVKNSIMWGNTAPFGAQIENDNSTSTVSASVVQGGYAGGTNILTDDPLLGARGDYGGATQTIPLLPGSAAIDADQHGLSCHGPARHRRGATCDLGAFESRGFALTKTSGDNQSTTVTTVFANPLGLSVTSANGEPVDGGTVTFSGPCSGASTNPATNTATIAGGAVSQSVTANSTTGSYTVIGAADGAGGALTFALQNTQLILYARPGGLTSGACESWMTACELPYALTSSVYGQEIWVMAGTYTPDASGDRAATFQLKSGVALYGGFAGTETLRSQRDWATHVTTLSGDIGTSGDVADNSYHVVTGSGADATAVLDGFTITGGNADGSAPDNSGGGLYTSGGSPTLTNVIFRANSAHQGGGMHNDNSSSPTLTNVTLSGNVGDLQRGRNQQQLRQPDVDERDTQR